LQLFFGAMIGDADERVNAGGDHALLIAREVARKSLSLEGR
jgi:hypothetical protein